MSTLKTKMLKKEKEQKRQKRKLNEAKKKHYKKSQNKRKKYLKIYIKPNNRFFLILIFLKRQKTRKNEFKMKED